MNEDSIGGHQQWCSNVVALFFLERVSAVTVLKIDLVKTYVFVLFIVQTCRSKEDDSNDVIYVVFDGREVIQMVLPRGRVGKMNLTVLENRNMILLKICSPGNGLSIHVTIVCFNKILAILCFLEKLMILL